MPRIGRQASSTGYYHVMVRGINKEFVFQSDSERRLLLELLCEQHAKDSFELAAWCIMSNHLHALVKAELATLSRAVKVINLRYAARYNSMHQRVGPVFGDRYRSEAIEDEAYLLGALRYIHMNPVQANLVQDPADYRWSSYKEYTADAVHISETQKAFVLGLLGGSARRFTEFHRQSDLTLYLETGEDRESYRLAVAHKVLEQFCALHGIERAEQLKGDPERFSAISRQLTQNVGLTLRKAAEMLETSHTKVYQALQED
ncbi:MAG: transposase [Selenomonadales bacterium]|nr:transposase [Selenomonadales bacterium]MBS3985942.1 transposase [Selenomonadales bacterium]